MGDRKIKVVDFIHLANSQASWGYQAWVRSRGRGAREFPQACVTGKTGGTVK